MILSGLQSSLDQFARQLARCLYIRRRSMSEFAARPSFGVRRPGSTGRLDLLRNIIGDLQIIAPSPLPKSFHDAFAVLYLAILTHFPFAFEPRDCKAEADDGAKHAVDIRFRCIGHLP